MLEIIYIPSTEREMFKDIVHASHAQKQVCSFATAANSASVAGCIPHVPDVLAQTCPPGVHAVILTAHAKSLNFLTIPSRKKHK